MKGAFGTYLSANDYTARIIGTGKNWQRGLLPLHPSRCSYFLNHSLSKSSGLGNCLRIVPLVTQRKISPEAPCDNKHEMRACDYIRYDVMALITQAAKEFF